MKHADREARAQIEALGFTLVRDRKHMVWRHPVGGILVTAASMGRGRAFANTIANAERIAKGEH